MNLDVNNDNNTFTVVIITMLNGEQRVWNAQRNIYKIPTAAVI
jgi:hypothetical protein